MINAILPPPTERSRKRWWGLVSPTTFGWMVVVNRTSTGQVHRHPERLKRESLSVTNRQQTGVYDFIFSQNFYSYSFQCFFTNFQQESVFISRYYHRSEAMRAEKHLIRMGVFSVGCQKHWRSGDNFRFTGKTARRRCLLNDAVVEITGDK